MRHEQILLLLLWQKEYIRVEESKNFIEDLIRLYYDKQFMALQDLDYITIFASTISGKMELEQLHFYKKHVLLSQLVLSVLSSEIPVILA